MKQIFEIAGAVIVSFGGSGVILLGLSSWLGKVWAKRILETEKKNFTIEIEEYKKELEKEINLVKSIIDKSLHVTKLQYDKEFSIYLEIWEDLIGCVVSTKNLYPNFENVPTDDKELEDFNINKWDRFVEKYNKYSTTVDKYSPFYDEMLYEGFKELRELCHKQGTMFKIDKFDRKYSLTYTFTRDEKMSVEDHKEVYIETPKKINDLQNSLQKEIREYLKRLQIMEK